jgi:hypothetical protein
MQVDKKRELLHLVTTIFWSYCIQASVGHNQVFSSTGLVLAFDASKVAPSSSVTKQVPKQVTPHSTTSCKSKWAAEVIER